MPPQSTDRPDVRRAALSAVVRKTLREHYRSLWPWGITLSLAIICLYMSTLNTSRSEGDFFWAGVGFLAIGGVSFGIYAKRALSEQFLLDYEEEVTERLETEELRELLGDASGGLTAAGDHLSGGDLSMIDGAQTADLAIVDEDDPKET